MHALSKLVRRLRRRGKSATAATSPHGFLSAEERRQLGAKAQRPAKRTGTGKAAKRGGARGALGRLGSLRGR